MDDKTFNTLSMMSLLAGSFGLNQATLEKKVFKLLDSSGKEEGIVNRYYKAMETPEGNLVPYEGTKLLLDFLGIPLADYEAKIAESKTV